MFTENGVIQYIQAFEYDNNYRLVNAEAYGKNNNYNMNYKLQMDYSPAGRILRKFMRGNKKDNNGVHPFAYENHYNYGHHSNPFAIDIVDNHLGSDEHFEWDRKGNMVYHLDKHTITERRFSWTEDNRLEAVVDNYTGSFYNYDAAGERNYKLTGSTVEVYQNGGIVYTPVFDKHTLYASPLITINEQGYTKHYFEEGSRICSSIGDGGFKYMYHFYEEPNAIDQDDWHNMQKNIEHSIYDTYAGNFKVEPYYEQIKDLYDVVMHYYTYQDGYEPVFYYHTDHLGSASYITDDAADVVQQIAYLPYGEEWVDIRSNGYFGSAYKFNCKEKDEETGYNYYGARYYTDRLSIFLSVDRFADKFPWQSSYCYAGNNPIGNIDVNGDSVWFTQKGNNITMHLAAKLYNNSGDNINMERASNDIANGIRDTFKGEFKIKGQTYNLLTDIHIGIANSMDEVDASDHLFVLRDADGKSARGAINQLGGKVMNIASNDFANNNWLSNTFSWNNTRTAIHEFGHSWGLQHTKETFNLMVQGGYGKTISSKQIAEIVTRPRSQINVGPNSIGAFKAKMPYPYIHSLSETIHVDRLFNYNKLYNKGR